MTAINYESASLVSDNDMIPSPQANHEASAELLHSQSGGIQGELLDPGSVVSEEINANFFLRRNTETSDEEELDVELTYNNRNESVRELEEEEFYYKQELPLDGIPTGELVRLEEQAQLEESEEYEVAERLRPEISIKRKDIDPTILIEKNERKGDHVSVVELESEDEAQEENSLYSEACLDISNGEEDIEVEIVENEHVEDSQSTQERPVLRISVSAELDQDNVIEQTRSQYEKENAEANGSALRASVSYEYSKLQLQFPTFLIVRGDTYFLAPFHGNKDATMESIISLFSWDEIIDRTLGDFFELLRHNGDLIDAYNFNSEDELKLLFCELCIAITEDSVDAEETYVLEILSLYQKLRENTPSNQLPGQLTIFVTMQQRFKSQFKKLKTAYSEGKGFESLGCCTDERGYNKMVESKTTSKKRKANEQCE